MAARGSAVRRRERRMRSWWRHEQASVRMAMITAGHHSYRKPAGIEIGVQAGTPLFNNFDMESDDTYADDLNLLAPVTEYVIPAPAVPHVAQTPVIENMTSAPVNEYIAPAPGVTLSVPGQQLPPANTMTGDTTDDTFDISDLVHTQFSSAVETVAKPFSPHVVGPLRPLKEFLEPVYNPVHQEQITAGETTEFGGIPCCAGTGDRFGNSGGYCSTSSS